MGFGVLAKICPAWKREGNAEQACKAPWSHDKSPNCSAPEGVCVQGLEPAEKALEFY